MFPTWEETLKLAKEFWNANHSDLLFKQRFSTKDAYMAYVRTNYNEAKKRGEDELKRNNRLIQSHLEDLHTSGTRLKQFKVKLDDADKILREKEKIDRRMRRPR